MVDGSGILKIQPAATATRPKSRPLFLGGSVSIQGVPLSRETTGISITGLSGSLRFSSTSRSPHSRPGLVEARKRHSVGSKTGRFGAGGGGVADGKGVGVA